jgi:hypothetical protein
VPDLYTGIVACDAGLCQLANPADSGSLQHCVQLAATFSCSTIALN